MQAHKALEALDEINGLGRIDKAVFSIMERSLVESQKFEFDFGDFPSMTEEEMQRNIQALNLPNLLCYFSIPTVGSVLARDHEDCILLQPFLSMRDRVGMLPPEMPILLDKRDGSLCCKSEDPGVLKEWNNPTDDGVKAVVGLVSLVVRGLAVLNCSNVKTVDNDPPSALNKKRMKNGKRPFFTYKTLHIETSKPTTSTPVQSGDRLGPRLHMRRGHIRKLQSGVTTWVQSCMVGDTAKGMVMKEYRVT